MWRYVFQMIRRQPGKSALASSGFLLAACALILLSATTQTTVVQANQIISQSWRSSYDLVVLLFMFMLTMISIGGMAAIQRNAIKAWHASTSLDQINGISVASLSRPHAGLKPLPLLPARLPGGTQATEYGVITDLTNPNILKTFVADYRIDGKDVLLYEQPTYGPFLSSIAKAVRIGKISGQLFQDDVGNTALQWYQHGMLCQVTSNLPVNRLVALAGEFQPIKSWDLLL